MRKAHLRTLNCNGIVTEDREEWQQEVKRGCEARYFDEKESLEVQKARVDALMQKDPYTTRPKPQVSNVLNARNKLKCHSASGGDCAIVVEMLKALMGARYYLRRVVHRALRE